MRVFNLGLILIFTALIAPCLAQEDSRHCFYLGLPESYLREKAIEKVLPVYPEEALRRGISGLVRLKVEIGIDGKVLRIKVKPRSFTQLSKVAAEATRKWRFEPSPDPTGLGRSNIGRLTFEFIIINGVGKVQLYKPGPTAPDHGHLGYFNSPKEFKEWEVWEEVPR